MAKGGSAKGAAAPKLQKQAAGKMQGPKKGGR